MDLRHAEVKRGVVATFDAARGLGVVTTSDGEPFGFHCVDIADGTRAVNVGQQVLFAVRTGLLGADEAVDIYSIDVESRT